MRTLALRYIRSESLKQPHLVQQVMQFKEVMMKFVKCLQFAQNEIMLQVVLLMFWLYILFICCGWNEKLNRLRTIYDIL